MAKKKTSMVAVKPKAKKPKLLDLGSDYAEVYVEPTNCRGDRRQAAVRFFDSGPDELRKLAEWCIQAADWMDDDK